MQVTENRKPSEETHAWEEERKNKKKTLINKKRRGERKEYIENSEKMIVKNDRMRRIST